MRSIFLLLVQKSSGERNKEHMLDVYALVWYCICAGVVLYRTPGRRPVCYLGDVSANIEMLVSPQNDAHLLYTRARVT